MAISSLIVRGDKSISQRLSTIAKRYNIEKANALEREAEIELAEMKRRTPYDRGWLHDSGKIVMGHSWNTVEALFSFGGGRVDYAVYVHENLEAHHPVGQAKFMESVLNESRRFMTQRLATRLHVDKVA